MNIIKKIFRLWKTKDELCGDWLTEDGSGFSVIKGSWIQFKSDGNGKYESWSNNNDETSYNLSGEINWNRISENKIEIIEKDNSEKTIIEYKLEKVNNRIELSNLHSDNVSKNDIKGFWFFYQVMFRKK